MGRSRQAGRTVSPGRSRIIGKIMILVAPSSPRRIRTCGRLTILLTRIFSMSADEMALLCVEGMFNLRVKLKFFASLMFTLLNGRYSQRTVSGGVAIGMQLETVNANLPRDRLQRGGQVS